MSKKLPPEKRFAVNTYLAFRALQSALEEPIAYKKKWKTDIYGIARQFYPRLKRADFMAIKDLPLSTILDTILKYQLSIDEKP